MHDAIKSRQSFISCISTLAMTLSHDDSTINIVLVILAHIDRNSGTFLCSTISVDMRQDTCSKEHGVCEMPLHK